MKLKRQSLRDLTTRVERHAGSTRHRRTADRAHDGQQPAAAEVNFVDRYSRLLAVARSSDETVIADEPHSTAESRR
jgi:hypothetical protein